MMFVQVPESSKKFVSLEEEEEGDQTDGFRAHVADAVLISDQRYMVQCGGGVVRLQD